MNDQRPAASEAATLSTCSVWLHIFARWRAQPHIGRVALGESAAFGFKAKGTSVFTEVTRLRPGSYFPKRRVVEPRPDSADPPGLPGLLTS